MEEQVLNNGFGVGNFDGKVYLYAKNPNSRLYTFSTFISQDGLSFFHHDDTAVIVKPNGMFENVSRVENMRITRMGEEYIATYCLKTIDRITLSAARSHDGLHWYKIGRLNGVESTGMLVPDYTHNGNHVVYYGNAGLKVGYSENLLTWKFDKQNILTPIRHQRFTIGTIVVRDEGIYVFYFVLKRHDQMQRFSLKMMLFDRDDPEKPLFEKEKTIWRQNSEFATSVTPFGLTFSSDVLISYWQGSDGSMQALVHANPFPQKDLVHRKLPLTITKYHRNPILTPIQDHVWESEAVFNAASFYEAGKVHLIYRAVGKTGVSMLGYATSTDGFTVDRRHPHPVYVPSQLFEGALQKSCAYPNQYVSGPGCGGCEDPRITKIDGRYYLTYVAFDGWGPPRLALSSIAESDFMNQHWNWTSPVLISPPGVVDKSGCILPEKINGKYVIFHRVFPDILVDYVDTLDFDGTTFLAGQYKIRPRQHHWDSRKIGVGPPPLKTKEGWLVIYNAVSNRDDSRYKIGAMLLNLSDPTEVIARSEHPILEPTEHYENQGLKYGVVYPCGAVIKEHDLIVYYGGSDRVLCAATAPVKRFVNTLQLHGNPLLSRTYIEKVHNVLMT